MKLNFSLKKKKGPEADVDVDAEVDADEEIAEEVAEEKSTAKSKSKSSDGAAQQFLIDHGEKIAVSLVILFAGWMVYSSVGTLVPPPRQTHAELKKGANRVRDLMESETNTLEDVGIPDFSKLLDEGRTSIDPTGFEMGSWYYPPVPRKKRGDPEFLPVSDVYAAADVPFIFVNALRFPGRVGRNPELSAEEKADRDKQFKRKEERRRKAREDYVRSEKAKIKAWFRREMREVKDNFRGDPVRYREEEEKLKAEKERKEKSLEDGGVVRDSVQTLPLSPGFALGGVKLPGQEEKQDGRRSARPKADAEKVLVEARPFVVIKGLLPVLEQESIYDEAFAAAHHYRPSRDRPLYFEVTLLRKEVPRGVDVSKLDWKTAKQIKFGSIRMMNNKGQARTRKGEIRTYLGNTWAFDVKEVIDARYVHDDTDRKLGGMLTKPLAPRVYGSWKTNGLALHPAVPVAKPRARTPETATAQGAGLESTRTPAKKEETPAVDVNDAEGLLEYEEEASAEGGALPPVDTEPPPEEPATTETEEPAEPLEVAHRLVRVFDYRVTPGKRYSYRVAVALVNPNSERFEDIKNENVESPKNRAKTLMTSSWSEPTEPVMVSDGERLMSEGILKEIPGTREQEANVVVRVVDLGRNELLQMRMQLPRGGMASGRGAVFSIDPVKREFTREPKRELFTGLTLLDMRGDVELRKGSLTPTECLFMDERGNVFKRDSFIDRRDVGRFQALEENFDKNAVAEDEEGEAGADGDADGEKDDDDFDALFGEGE